jgi:hypothetical protein
MSVRRRAQATSAICVDARCPQRGKHSQHVTRALVKRIGCDSATELQRICEDTIAAGDKVLAITPNMDKSARGGYALNFTNQPSYWIFIQTSFTNSERERVHESNDA